jgi:phosphoadenosine phosphosulfate reductase
MRGRTVLVTHKLDGSCHDLVAIAIQRLRTFCPPDGYYVAFSGGKDSQVILDLVRRAGVPYDAHFNVTSVDPPELYRFIREHYAEVERHRPPKTMWQLIVDKMMPPTRTVRYCCEHLKERGGTGRHVVTGVRWAESLKRTKRRTVETCMRDKTKRYVNPIIEWSNADVWRYIRERNMPYCCLYDQGFRRVGCVGCPMAGRRGREIEFARWPGFERSYRRAFAAAAAANIQRLGPEYSSRRYNGQHMRWDSGDAMFDWWMSDKHQRKNPDQGVLFE